MANKVGIGIEAQFDAGSVERQINALGQKIAAMNKVQFTPISNTTKSDLDKIVRQFEQLRKIHGDLNKRLNATGQGNANLLNMDWEKLYPDANSRARQMRKVFEYSTGSSFNAAPPPPGKPPRPNSSDKNREHAAWAGLGVQVAQSGLRAAGPAGGVAAGALGTGMSAGFGAGLMGLMGGMLALGVGKLVGAATEKINQAEDNSVALDRLKRTLGDVNVSFEALKSVVHSGADNLKITYAEAGQLATQFVKLGNVTTDQYKTIGDELGVGVGMSRAFGMDPSQGVGVLGQMRGLGVTQNTQESRRFALLIGETIGKSGAFAKADEVMDAIAGFASSQTRNNLGVANVAGYAGMFSAMVGSGIPGMDPAGAAGLLGRINSSLSAGGAKGEASQFFTGLVGSRMGLDPIQTQILREGGAFATNDSMFGEGSAASRYGISGPSGNKTFLQGSLEELRRQYGGNKGLLAQATANHLGIGINQAMSLLQIEPNEIGEMQKYGDLGKLSGNGIGNLSKALYGSAGDRQGLAQSLLGRSDVSSDDKNALKAAMGTEAERQVLARLTAQYDQERTQGSDIRDSKNRLDNIATNIADKMVPLMNEMRHGIMFIAGKGEKSPKQVMEEVLKLEEKDRASGIRGASNAAQLAALAAPDAIRGERAGILKELMTNRGMSAEERAEKQKRVQELSEQLAHAEEEARKKVIKLREEEAAALKKSNEDLEKSIKEMRGSGTVVPGAAESGGAPVGEAPAAAGGRRYTTGGGGSPGSTAAAMKFFMSKGWTREQAAGIVANLVAESKLNPGIEGDGGSAYGIGQWHKDRQGDFAKWAGKGIRGSSFEEQLGFVHHELTEGKERPAGDRLRAAKSAGAAGAVVSCYYERPGDVAGEAAKRAGMANGIYGTPIPGGNDATAGSEKRFIFDAAPLEVIHKNERGDVIRSGSLSTSIRPASAFGTERYA